MDRELVQTDFGVASFIITIYDSESFGDEVLRIFKTFYFNGWIGSYTSVVISG